MTTNHKNLLWILIFISLTGCGTVPTSTPTLTPVPSKTSAPTTTILPTKILTPTETSVPTATLSSTPNADQTAVLERLRMVYVKEGNLYIQDGTNPLKQLTNTGQDRGPLISDDGQKIVFYRNLPDESSQVYSISADGSQEKPVINRSILNALNLGYPDPDNVRTEDMVFVPGTHLLLFGTLRVVDPGIPSYMSYDDLLILDTDTAKIKSLFSYKQVYRIEVSPNGKLIAIQTPDQVKIIDITGRVVLTLLTYDIYNGHPIKDYGDPWREFTLDFYWMGDSSALFVFMPRNWDEVDYDYHFALYNVWKYPLNGASPVKINLMPFPSMPQAISPDGKWLVYDYEPRLADIDMTDADRSYEWGIYIANLQDGSAKFLTNESGFNYGDLHWAPDSAHFNFKMDEYHAVFGNLNGEMTRKDIQGFIGWVDASHYLYDNVRLGEIGTETTFKIAGFAGVNASYPGIFTFVLMDKK
jgi:hypothetical protein